MRKFLNFFTFGERILILFLFGGALIGFGLNLLLGKRSVVTQPAIRLLENPLSLSTDSVVSGTELADKSEGLKKRLILDGEKIDINRATVQELQSLPGIGRVTAENIVSLREKNGRFERVDDLLKVKGIGKAKLSKIYNFVTL